jgi:hypothetical protein
MQIKTNPSNQETNLRESFLKTYQDSPIPENEILSNLGLFANRQLISKILFLNELYQKIIHTHGVIMEFGVRWGQNLSLFHSFRGIYEPFNHNRKIVGFDTFSGFPSVHEKDGNDPIIVENAFSVTEGYEDYLDTVLKYHQQESPIPHMKKYELVKGDASKTIHEYLKDNPETIIAFAYFDFDIYEPTYECLKAILPHLTKGSILAFDELNCPAFPGETLAVKELLGLNNLEIQRSPLTPRESYIVFK